MSVSRIPTEYDIDLLRHLWHFMNQPGSQMFCFQGSPQIEPNGTLRVHLVPFVTLSELYCNTQLQTCIHFACTIVHDKNNNN